MAWRRPLARAIFVAWICAVAVTFLWVSLAGRWSSLDTQNFLLLAATGPAAVLYAASGALRTPVSPPDTSPAPLPRLVPA